MFLHTETTPGPPISCPFTLLPSVTVLPPLGLFSTLQILQAHLSLVAFALGIPYCQGLFLHSLLHLISSHHLDPSWKISCAGRTSLTISPLTLPYYTAVYSPWDFSLFDIIICMHLHIICLLLWVPWKWKMCLPGSLFYFWRTEYHLSPRSTQWTFVR